MTDALVRNGDTASLARGEAMLLRALGPDIREALGDDDVVEIMVNPDGRLWVDRASSGREGRQGAFAGGQIERIIRLVASQTCQEVYREAPIVSADIDVADSGHQRFEGLLPPLVTGPCFAIRKHKAMALSLDDYVQAGLLTPDLATILRAAVVERANVLIAGGSGTGKTTFANALLTEIARQGDRLVLIEDTQELHCAAQDWVALKTRAEVVSMRDLVRSSLRLRPDRIIVGEVRGGEALDLLKAWNTGHPGGVATIHANTAGSALTRLEQLALEATHSISRDLIADAVQLIVVLEGRGRSRQITEIASIQGIGADGSFDLRALHRGRNSTGDRYAQAL